MKPFTKPGHVTEALWEQFLQYCKYLGYEPDQKLWDQFINILSAEGEE